MRTKRSANRILATLLMFAAIIAPSAVTPGSYLSLGTPSAANIAIASSASGYVSLFNYHDY
jgi:hypothetical protein